MNKLIFVVGLILTSVLFGCSFVPFQKTNYFLVKGINSERVLAKHKELSPDKFKMINTVIFQYRTKKFLSLGYLSVDVNEKAFDLVAMNSVGIKLVEISAKNKKLIINNVIDEISKKGDISKVLVDDIGRIYLDKVPLIYENIRKTKNQIIVNKKNEDNVTKYIFAGKKNYLVEKIHYEKKKKNWSVRYYEHFIKDGKLYPKGIIFWNHLHKYKLIINVKEVL
ncbi:MAG: hypothetical protein KAJ14_15145 [Candidatus Omnitrophica bacterium]|nr:hypothetical protein [Candidatus Omnitrophota bacterium]MCK5494445.1 hypothetical protein [Candidatus Omnitrophota bacterium]